MGVCVWGGTLQGLTGTLVLGSPRVALRTPGPAVPEPETLHLCHPPLGYLLSQCLGASPTLPALAGHLLGLALALLIPSFTFLTTRGKGRRRHV